MVLSAVLLVACTQPDRMPTPRAGFADVNGARLYYEEFGSGRPVVLIHGGNLDRTMWDDQVPELARRFRVIRYDARGFGRSSRAADKPFSAHDDLHGLLEHLRIDQADLVGLLVVGTRDSAPLRALSDSIAAKAPDPKRVWIQNSGHLPNQEYRASSTVP